jgi:hypothetical protein
VGTEENSRAKRFFVSYRRRAEVDSRLASVLVDSLRAAGAEVFIDVDMVLGIDWSAEIERRVRWCDYLVVLLSGESVTSEMVQAEVRRAHHAPSANGQSKLLPIRVNFLGQLGYELDSYLGKLQYALWRTPADDNRIVGEVLRASASGSGFRPLDHDKPLAAPAQERPVPKADMGALRRDLAAPGTALADDDRFYVRRDADHRIDTLAGGRPGTLVIRGPNQTGKSSLLLRFLAKCQAAGTRVAFVDLMAFGGLKDQSFRDFAKTFLSAITEELELPDLVLPQFDRGIDLTNFVHTEVLPRIEGNIVLALDEADRIIGAPWQEDFYSMLRSWDGRRTQPGKKARWGRFGLAMAIATEPRMLIDKGYQSPFNVTPPVELGGFDRTTLTRMNDAYGGLLSTAQLDTLYSLLGGHPYLTALALYRVVQTEYTFERIVELAASENGPFGDHLRSRLERVYSAKLHEAMGSVVRNGTVPGKDRQIYYRLEAAGLVREAGDRIVPANEVYAKFFRAVL